MVLKQVVINVLPDDAAIEEAKKAAQKAVKAKKCLATCPCCKQQVATVGNVRSLAEHGLCRQCKLFKEGKLDYVVALVPSTLEEIVESPPESLGHDEIKRLQQACKDLKKGE